MMTWSRLAPRLAAAVMGAMLGINAYVQINDPDAASWIVFYALPSILSLSYAVIPTPHGSPLWQKLCVADLLYSVTFTAIELSRTGSASITLGSEEGRELMGSTLVITWLLTLLLHSARLVGTATVLTNVAAVLVMCGYYGYLVATGSVTLDEHCRGMFAAKAAHSY